MNASHFDSRGTAMGQHYLEAFAFQITTDDARQRDLIVNNEYAKRVSHL
jgi:hypothetical protein